MSIKIGNKLVGHGYPVFVIAEVAQSHEGSLGMAHSYIDAAANSGADAIKFQTHIARAESTRQEPFRVKFTSQDESRYDYWRRMEFTEQQWNELSEHALQRNLIFLSSPFSNEAALMLKRIGVPAWKIGSGESFSKGLIDMLIEFHAPILLSTGMSSWDEIDQLVELLNSKKTDYILLQCTSKYPTPLNQVGLNVLEEMKQRYNCLTGLSDHSGTLYPTYAAMARGCNVVEVHVAFSKLMFGADITSSITFEELRMLCSYRDALATMNLNPVNKNELAIELTNTKKIFTKSVALKQNLKKGALLTEDMLIFKKPGTGIPEVELHLVVGKRLIKDMSPDILLSWEDLE